jgi:hypothetical protein
VTLDFSHFREIRNVGHDRQAQFLAATAVKSLDLEWSVVTLSSVSGFVHRENSEKAAVERPKAGMGRSATSLSSGSAQDSLFAPRDCPRHERP